MFSEAVLWAVFSSMRSKTISYVKSCSLQTTLNLLVICLSLQNGVDLVFAISGIMAK